MGNQSGVVFGFLATAFFVFITLRGELPTYAGLLLLSPSGSGGSVTPSNTSATANSNTNNAARDAVTQAIITGAIGAL